MKIPERIVNEVLDQVKGLLARNIDRMKTSTEDLPLILCGGGSILIDLQQKIPGITQVHLHLSFHASLFPSIFERI